jgi:hypothetical protein
MKEDKHDRRPPGGQRPNVRGDSARVKRRERGPIGGCDPSRRLPEHAGAAGKGGEHRHELNIL